MFFNIKLEGTRLHQYVVLIVTMKMPDKISIKIPTRKKGRRNPPKMNRMDPTRGPKTDPTIPNNSASPIKSEPFF